MLSRSFMALPLHSVLRRWPPAPHPLANAETGTIMLSPHSWEEVSRNLCKTISVFSFLTFPYNSYFPLQGLQQHWLFFCCQDVETDYIRKWWDSIAFIHLHPFSVSSSTKARLSVFRKLAQWGPSACLATRLLFQHVLIRAQDKRGRWKEVCINTVEKSQCSLKVKKLEWQCIEILIKPRFDFKICMNVW